MSSLVVSGAQVIGDRCPVARVVQPLEGDPAAAFRQVDGELLGSRADGHDRDIGESVGVVGIRSHPQPVRGLAFAAGVAEKGDPPW